MRNTKKLRLSIYKKALVLLIEDINVGVYCWGLCYYLEKALFKLTKYTMIRNIRSYTDLDVTSGHKVFQIYKELADYVPSKYEELIYYRSSMYIPHMGNRYWFSKDEIGHAERIRILKSVINTLENEINNKTKVKKGDKQCNNV